MGTVPFSRGWIHSRLLMREIEQRAPIHRRLSWEAKENLQICLVLRSTRKGSFSANDSLLSLNPWLPVEAVDMQDYVGSRFLQQGHPHLAVPGKLPNLAKRTSSLQIQQANQPCQYSLERFALPRELGRRGSLTTTTKAAPAAKATPAPCSCRS